MSSPGREMMSARAAASSPSPSIASHPQRQHPPFRASEAAASSSSTAALPGRQDQQQPHHHDPSLSNNNNIINNDDNNDDGDDDDGAAPSDRIIPPFAPIFTLLTNTTTNTTVHPRVHYLFSDDDASAVLTAPQTDPLHRALIVDLAPPPNPNGKWTVSCASSLTPDFAVTASQLSLQQHGSGSGSGGGNNESEDGDTSEGASTSVMLRVEGVEREGVPAVDNPKPNLRGSSSSGGSGAGAGAGAGAGIVGREDVDQLTEEFKRRMGVLKKVVDEGERRRETLNRLNEELPTTRPDGGDDGHNPPVEGDAAG